MENTCHVGHQFRDTMSPWVRENIKCSFRVFMVPKVNFEKCKHWLQIFLKNLKDPGFRFKKQTSRKEHVIIFPLRIKHIKLKRKRNIKISFGTSAFWLWEDQKDQSPKSMLHSFCNDCVIWNSICSHYSCLWGWPKHFAVHCFFSPLPEKQIGVGSYSTMMSIAYEDNENRTRCTE